MDSAPPRERNVGPVEQNLLGPGHDGLEAGSAQPVHRERAGFLRYARAQTDVPGQVDCVGGGLQGIAVEYMAHLPGLDACRLHRRLGREDPQVGGGEVPQRPAEGAKRSALAREEDDLPVEALRAPRALGSHVLLL